MYALQALDVSRHPVSLESYRGKVALVVNTASECGYTPQYAGLEQLYETYAARGFTILAFPSDDFGGQEPGSEDEILAFTKSHYGVTFPIFAKVHVHGDGQSELFARLAAARGEPKWNFHKYLIGRDGRLRAAFPSATEPESRDVRSAIEQAIGESG